MDSRYLEVKKVREIINQLSKYYQVIHVYNPICKEETEQYIIFDSYVIPNQGTFSYTINGKDITDFITKYVHVGSISNIEDVLKVEIENIEKRQYLFGKDYSFRIVK